VPFVTNWMGEHTHEPLPTAIYGAVLVCAGIAYYILVRVIIRAQGAQSKLRQAIGSDFKGTISPILYIAGIVSALFWRHEIAWAFYAFVALIWLVPDRRIERVV